MSTSSRSPAEEKPRKENILKEEHDRIPGVDVEDEEGFAISRSKIRFLDGDIVAGNDVAARDTDFELIRGDVKGNQRLFDDVHGATVFGDMETRKVTTSGRYDGTIFRDSHLNTLVGKSAKGRYFGKDSFANLTITDGLYAEHFEANNFVISRESRNPPESTTSFDPGDEKEWKAFKDFKQQVKRKADDIYAVPLFNPDVDSVTAEEFFELEEELSSIVDQEIGQVKGRENELAEAINALREFNQLPENRLYARTLETLARASEDELETVSSFTNKFNYMKGSQNLREDFVDRLEKGRRVGSDIIDISDAVIIEDDDFYSRSVTGEIEALLKGWEIPDVDYMKEKVDESVFYRGFVSKGGMLENAYNEFEDEVRQIYTLAEFLGKDFEFDTEAWVRDQIERDKNGENTDIDDPTDVKQRLQEELEDLQNKKYQWTKEALESLQEYEILEGLNNKIGFALRTTNTDIGEKMTEFQGEDDQWNWFIDRLERKDHYGIHLLRPEVPSTVESYDEIRELERDMREIAESEIGDIEGLMESNSEFRKKGILGYTKHFADQEERRYAKVIAEALENEDVREDIGEFGKLLDQLEEGQRERILEELYSEEFGEDLGELAHALKYEGFVNSDAEEVQHLLETGEEYEGLQALDSVDEEIVERLENLNYLADFLDQDLNINVEEASEEELRAAIDENEGLVVDAIEQVGNYVRSEKFGREFSFSPFISGTDRGKNLTEYTGEGWERFMEELEEHPERYREIFALDPELEQIEDLQDFREVNRKMEQLIEIEYGSEEGLAERLADKDDDDSIVERINTFPDLPARINAQILSRVLEMPYEDDTNKERVEDFGKTLSKLDEDVRQELYSILGSQEDKELLEGEGCGEDVEYSSNSKLGRTLANIGRAREYINFLDGFERKEIEDLLEGRIEDPIEVNEKLKEERPEWAEKLEEIYERHEEEIEHVAYLSEFTGENFNYDEVEKSKLLNWAFNPNNDKNEIDWDSLEQEITEKIENQKRSKLETALRQVGREDVEEEYEDALDKRPEDIEEVTKNEIAALRIRKDKGENDEDLREVADIFLQEKDDVYHREENQEWIEDQSWIDREEWEEEYGSVVSELQDPDLSDMADEEFQVSDAEYDSALRVEVKDEEQDYDEEKEKEKRWQDMRETLGRLDTAVAEQLDKVDKNSLRDPDGNELEEKVSLAETVRDKLEREDLDDEEEAAYSELKDDIRQFYGVEEMSGAVPDELDIIVSPIEDTVRMGHGFDSCLDYDGGTNRYSALTNAVDANKFAMYALDDEGNERARVKAAITDDEELIYFNTSRYKDIEVDTTRHFTGYMERLAEHWGLEDVKHTGELEGSTHDHVDILVAHDWYGKA